MCRHSLTVVTAPMSERAASASDTASLAQKFAGEVFPVDDVEAAFRKALDLADGKLLVVTGSLYLVGSIYSFLKEK